MSVLLRRRKPSRTVVGSAIQHWSKIRLGLKLLAFVSRVRRGIRIAVLAVAGVTVVAVVRRLRRRGRYTPPSTYSPPPASPPGWSGGTRETGYEAGPGTQTERNLESEKSDDEGKSPTLTLADAPPPVEDEPPAET